MIQLKVEQPTKEPIPKIKFRLEEYINPIDGMDEIHVHAIDKNGTEIVVFRISVNNSVLIGIIPNLYQEKSEIITIGANGTFDSYVM